METENNRNKLLAGVAIAALVLGGGGIMLGRTIFAPETMAAAAAPAEKAEEEGHVEGQILMEESRAKAAGIVTEALQSGGLGAEILAQGVVASTPEGEAVLTARADGAVVRINRQLGDFVRAGEAGAVMESRDAASIAAERSSASANLALARSTYAREKKLFDAKGNITGVSTGFKDLDEMTSGLQQSDLVIVAGRPSMGKTTFAMNMVETAVLHNDKPVLVFSLEMPADSLVIRMLSSIGRIDQTRMRNGKLEDEDWDKLSTAMTKLRGRPLFIDDTSGLSPSEMRSRARRIAREHGQLGLIMVDYLQLMQIKGSNENRTGEISEISRSLKLMAREFNCPVVALSQLNRSLEQRPNKRPVMSDLRESGAIEQDADIIMFVYRDEVYNPDKPEVKGVAEIIIGKQRNGPIGMVNLSFIGKHTRFENFMPMNGMQPKGEWGE